MRLLSCALIFLWLFSFVSPTEARHYRHHRHHHRQFMAYAVQPSASHPLLNVARRYVGSRKFTGKPGPWCRDALNAWMARAGYHLRNTSRRAIDAVSLGSRVSSPRPGDLVVMRHHVTIFAGYGGRGIIGLGGNQMRGHVGYSSYPPRRVVAYVRLP